MAPGGPVIVTLKLPSEQLRNFDFSGHKAPVPKKPRKRPGKPRSRGSAGTDGAPGEASDDTPQSTRRYASVEPRSGGSGIVSGGGADPILGNLPRSVKAAPMANTSGLDLDKTPSRKWHRTLVEFKSFTGFSYSVVAWTSDEMGSVWSEKQKREGTEQPAGNGKTDKPLRGSKPGPRPRVKKELHNESLSSSAANAESNGDSNGESNGESNRDSALPSTQQDPPLPTDEIPASEFTSEVPSEMASEPASEPPS